MSLFGALWLSAAVLGVAVLLGILYLAFDGRRRRASGDVDDSVLPLSARGAHGTLLLFTSEFCSRCPQVRRLLQSVAAENPAVTVAEYDLTHHADVAARFSVLQTPTTLLVDTTGSIAIRWGGVPRRADVSAAVTSLSPAPPARLHSYSQETS